MKYQISNIKFQISNRGFTLIEALVSLAIVGVVGFILADLMTRSFQGSAKTALLGTIKQNGQTALNIMDSKIRNADSVLCIVTTAGSNVIVVQNGGTNLTRFYFGTGFIAQDSLSKNADPNYVSDKYCSFTDNEVVSEQKLTDTTKVNVTDGVFTRNASQGFSDSIAISFKVKPVGTGAGFTEQLGSDGILFQTTINLR